MGPNRRSASSRTKRNGKPSASRAESVESIKLLRRIASCRATRNGKSYDVRFKVGEFSTQLYMPGRYSEAKQRLFYDIVKVYEKISRGGGRVELPVHFPEYFVTRDLKQFLDEIQSFLGEKSKDRLKNLVLRHGDAASELNLVPGEFQGPWVWSVAGDASPDYNSRCSSRALPDSVAVTAEARFPQLLESHSGGLQLNEGGSAPYPDAEDNLSNMPHEDLVDLPQSATSGSPVFTASELLQSPRPSPLPQSPLDEFHQCMSKLKRMLPENKYQTLLNVCERNYILQKDQNMQLLSGVLQNAPKNLGHRREDEAGRLPPLYGQIKDEVVSSRQYASHSGDMQCNDGGGAFHPDAEDSIDSIMMMQHDDELLQHNAPGLCAVHPQGQSQFSCPGMLQGASQDQYMQLLSGVLQNAPKNLGHRREDEAGRLPPLYGHITDEIVTNLQCASGPGDMQCSDASLSDAEDNNNVSQYDASWADLSQGSPHLVGPLDLDELQGMLQDDI